jgi:hypothetical protein
MKFMPEKVYMFTMETYDQKYSSDRVQHFRNSQYIKTTLHALPTSFQCVYEHEYCRRLTT